MLVFMFIQDPGYTAESSLAAFASPVFADSYCDDLHCTVISR